MVARGALGLGGGTPARDVNLFVSGGPLATEVAGFARMHAATVPAAHRFAELAPVGTSEAVLKFSTDAALVQLLFHETGHAIGLHYRHGRVSLRNGLSIASPMVGAYAWRSNARGPSTCGARIVAPDRGERMHSPRYSDCARTALSDFPRDSPGGGPSLRLSVLPHLNERLANSF